MSTKISRRDFITRAGAAGIVAPAFASSAFAQNPPAAPTNVQVGAGRSLLTPSDFTYIGYYDVQTNGTSSNTAQGLTHRYVNGDLRFLTILGGGRLDEFSLAGRSFGQLI